MVLASDLVPAGTTLVTPCLESFNYFFQLILVKGNVNFQLLVHTPTQHKTS